MTAGPPAAGYRFHKWEDMDVLAAPAASYRSDLLRDLVDMLPNDEHVIISRLFFGADQPGLRMLARELNVTPDRVKLLRDRGLARLAGVLDGETLSSLSA